MPRVTKEHGVNRVRIRFRGPPHVSNTFKSKTDARQWGEKTEGAMLLGLPKRLVCQASFSRFFNNRTLSTQNWRMKFGVHRLNRPLR